MNEIMLDKCFSQYVTKHVKVIYICLYIYVCVCVCIYIYIYTPVAVGVCVYQCTSGCMDVCVYVYLYICVYVGVCDHVYINFVSWHVPMYGCFYVSM